MEWLIILEGCTSKLPSCSVAYRLVLKLFILAANSLSCILDLFHHLGSTRVSFTKSHIRPLCFDCDIDYAKY